MARKSKDQLKKEAHNKAVRKYEAKTYKMVKIRLRLEEDKKIIEALEKEDSMNAYIVDILRQYIEGNN